MLTIDLPGFVLEHPDEGLVVFGTGVSRADEGGKFVYPSPLVEALMEVSPSPAGDLAKQMRDAGLDPSAVAHVIVSDLGFDQTGGLSGFEDAEVVVDRRARREDVGVRSLTTLLDRASIEEVRSWRHVDYDDSRPFAIFAGRHDVFGDGSVILVSLSGQDRGTQGAIVTLPGLTLMLAGNAAITTNSWRFVSKPRWTALPEEWWQHAWRIKKFAELATDLVVVPGHDLSVLAALDSPAVLLHTQEDDG